MAIQYFSVPGGTLIPHPGDTEIQDEASEPGVTRWSCEPHTMPSGSGAALKT
jgi:hypothetical protein